MFGRQLFVVVFGRGERGEKLSLLWRSATCLLSTVILTCVPYQNGGR